jgi:hypothetical protein
MVITCGVIETLKLRKIVETLGGLLQLLGAKDGITIITQNQVVGIPNIAGGN